MNTHIRGKVILALGADIKNRAVTGDGRVLYAGPDIGDLSEAGNFASFKRGINALIKKIKKKPDIIAHDTHPAYFSSRYAKSLAAVYPFAVLMPVQHHFAHIASVIFERGLKGPVIGVSFDGTGYGADGNIWGGEFLICASGRFRRFARLKYRKMPGGDKVVSEPWRMAVSVLGAGATAFLTHVPAGDVNIVLSMLSKNINCPLTSSAGRIFDAAAALMGLTEYASYEAEGPIRLERICDAKEKGSYRFGAGRESGLIIVDTDGMFRDIIRDIKRGVDPSAISGKFHNTMADIIISVVTPAARKRKINSVALSGGVFLNKVLFAKASEGLKARGFSVYTNTNIPVSDLNVGYGQYYMAGVGSRMLV